MVLSDLRYAKRELSQNNLSLVVVKDRKIVFATRNQGISGFLLAIGEVEKELVGSSVADRVVGRAAALLCAYAKVASVFAVTISAEGVEVLRKNDISYEYKHLVPHILNFARTAICPFEELTFGLVDPEEAYLKLKDEVGGLRPEGA